MRTHISNLYRLKNLHEIDFSYKLIEFDLNYLNDNPKELKKCLEKVESQVASDIQGPATIINIKGKRYAAIPSNKSITIFSAKANSINVPLKELPEIHCIRLDKSDQKELIFRLLDFEIRNHLQRRHQLWSINTYQFYVKKPVFSSTDTNVEVFGGFVYRLVEDKGNYFVSINPTYKYASKYFLSEMINSSNANDVIERLRGEKCIYQNGDNWYQIEIRGLGNSISTHTFVDDDNNTHIVKEYILNRTKGHRFNVSGLLKDNHLALLYKYPYKDMKDFHGATSIAKQLYSTDHPEVKSLHSKAILSPFVRFEDIGENINQFFKDIDWNGIRLEISSTPLEEKLKSFPIPDLKYNNNKILSTQQVNENEGIRLRDFGLERKNWIKENQILKQTTFIPQFLVVPQSMDPNFAKAFQKHTEEYLKKLSPVFAGFTLVTYNANLNEAATKQVNDIAREFRAKSISIGNALFLLPFDHRASNRKIKNFHDCLKKKFFPNIKFQCASLSRIQSFYSSYPTGNNLYHFKPKPELIDKYKSYLFNLMMEYLLINRKWPFALQENSNYDIYIGIDVHERYAGFCFFYKNGEEILFDQKEIPLIAGDVRKRAEKLKVETIYSKLLEKLETHIPIHAPSPNGIVIIRDGRSFGQEEIALKRVIEKLHEKGIVNKDTMKWGVLDLYKKTATPLRVAVKTDSYEGLDNTNAGTYKIIGNTNGFIFNTGYPFKIRGTANPIHIALKDGNIDFEKALQDVFDQTILAFSAPDRANSLPISIKIIDLFLAPVAAYFQDIDEEMEDVEIIEDEEQY